MYLFVDLFPGRRTFALRPAHELACLRHQVDVVLDRIGLAERPATHEIELLEHLLHEFDPFLWEVIQR